MGEGDSGANPEKPTIDVMPLWKPWGKAAARHVEKPRAIPDPAD